MAEIELGPDEYQVEGAPIPPVTAAPRAPFLERFNVVFLFLGIFGVFYALELLLGGAENGGVLITLGANYADYVDRGEIWRFVTATFLHGNLMHLIVNGYSFYILGGFVASVYGRSRLAVVFIVTAVIAALVSWLAASGLSVGASGGITGLLGLLLAFTMRFRERLNPAFRRSFLSNLAMIIGINIVISLAYPGIDNWAHLGGFVAGAACGFLMRPRILFGEETHTRPVRIAALAVTVLVAGAILMQTVYIAFAVLLPESGPFGTSQNSSGHVQIGHPRFFQVVSGDAEDGALVRFTNHFNRTVTVRLLEDGVAKQLMQELTAVGVRLTEGTKNSMRTVRISGTVVVRQQAYQLEAVLIQRPLDEATANQRWAEIRIVSPGTRHSEAAARLLDAMADKFYFAAGGVI